MATCQDIITRALRLLGVVSASNPATGADLESGLEALNALVDSMGLFRNLIPSPVEDTFGLTSGVANYAIGPACTFDTALPVKVDSSSFIRWNAVDYPLTIISGDDWADIPYKSLNGSLPQFLYYNRDNVAGELRLYPAPTVGIELHLRSWKTLTRYADVADDINLPAGYERMLAYNLAVEIAPEYGREAPPTVQRIAVSSRHGIEAAQAEIPKLKVPVHRRYDIRTDR